MRGALSTFLVGIAACGGSSPPTPAAPSGAEPVPPPAQKSPASTPLAVLATGRTPYAATWLPSGKALAWSRDELWLVDPSKPDELRTLHFDAAIESVATNQETDRVVVTLLDHTAHVLDELTVTRTIKEEWWQQRARLSPDGRHLALSGYTEDSPLKMRLFDLNSDARSRDIEVGDVPLFDATSSYLTDQNHIYDLGLNKLWRVKRDAGMLEAEWWGPRFARVGAKSVRLYDPRTKRDTLLDVACRPNVMFASVVIGAQYVRVCGNRFMRIDGDAGTLQRIKLPYTPDEPGMVAVVPHFAGGYVVSDTVGGQRVRHHVDVETGAVKPLSLAPTASEYTSPDVLRGELWLDLRDGLHVRRRDDDTTLVSWGGAPRAGLSEHRLTYTLRKRDGALESYTEVLAEGLRTTPWASQDTLVLRFGASAPLQGRVNREACLAPFAGANMACVCRDDRCNLRPLRDHVPPSASTATEDLYLLPRLQQSEVVLRGPHGERSATLPGFCQTATFVGARLFVLCMHNPKSMAVSELNPADLQVLATSAVRPEVNLVDLWDLGDELGVGDPERGVQLFPLGAPGAPLPSPAGTLYARPTFAILQRGDSIEVAGDVRAAERAVVCVDGPILRPWSACRAR